MWGAGTMFSEELWPENEKKCAVLRKPKQGRKRQELLAVALGVKVGVKGAFLWPPLKLFACSQISSLVRRAALTHNDNHFNYEKTHNFKVSSRCALPSGVRGAGPWRGALGGSRLVLGCEARRGHTAQLSASGPVHDLAPLLCIQLEPPPSSVLRADT